MVHKKVEHLLPQVYSGRLEGSPRDTKTSEGFTAGGLTFAAVAQQDLELSRGEFLQQSKEDAWETGSLGSTVVDGFRRRNDTASSSIDLRRQQYLAQGPNIYESTASLGGEVYGVPMSRSGTRDSQEWVILSEQQRTRLTLE